MLIQRSGGEQDVASRAQIAALRPNRVRLSLAGQGSKRAHIQSGLADVDLDLEPIPAPFDDGSLSADMNLLSCLQGSSWNLP